MLWVACVPPGDRTLVYALDDGEPIGRLDRDECVVGVGLRIPLGLTDSVAFDIVGGLASLGTCDLEGGSVLSCGIFDPIIPLEIEGTRVTGEGSSPVVIDDPLCTEATLSSVWSFDLLGDKQEALDATVAVTWRLPDTQECDAFEADILEAFPGNGRVDGCVVNFEFSGTLAAECRLDGQSLVCN